MGGENGTMDMESQEPEITHTCETCGEKYSARCIYLSRGKRLCRRCYWSKMKEQYGRKKEDEKV